MAIVLQLKTCVLLTRILVDLCLEHLIFCVRAIDCDLSDVHVAALRREVDTDLAEVTEVCARLHYVSIVNLSKDNIY